MTKKEINEKFNGVFTFTHVNEYEFKFVLKIFTIGNIITANIYDEKGNVRLYQDCTYNRWDYAWRVFKFNMEQIKDETFYMHKYLAKGWEGWD